MKRIVWLPLLVLIGCEATPVIVPGAKPASIYTYPIPSCLFICTSSISAIREDVVSGEAVTTGAKSNTQSGSNQGGSK